MELFAVALSLKGNYYLCGGGGLVTKACLTRVTHGLYPASLLCPWDSPGNNTGVGCHFLLQGIFPT